MKRNVQYIMIGRLWPRKIFQKVPSILNNFRERTSGTQNALIKERNEIALKELKSELSKAGEFTSKEWEELSERLLTGELRVVDSYVNTKNIDGVIMRWCETYNLFNAGQSFFHYLKNKSPVVNHGILSRYLSLCIKNEKFVLENKKLIVSLYKQLSNGEHIEPSVAERCIQAVCMFEDHWKKSFYLLERVKLLTEPTLSSYCLIIEACFKFGEHEKGWQMLQHVAKTKNGNPAPSCYIGYFHHLENFHRKGRFDISHLENIFHFLDEYHLSLPDIKTVDALEKLIFSLSDDRWHWSLKETFVTNNGLCMNCKRLLEPVKINENEFRELSDAFARKVLMGNNIFIKSTPEEITHFRDFLENAKPYDVVIDGLNVSYAFGHKGQLIMSKTLRAVVMHFVNANKKVVVLGRVHMKKWPESVMRDIYRNAKVFYAQNLSQDDPFILYAALRGGDNTKLISRDFMRSHIFALETPRDRLLFKKWLVSHQYRLGFFRNDGRPNILQPLPYCPTAQKLPLASPEWCWHVPYETEYLINPPDKREPPPKWLCIRRVLR